MKSAIRQWRVMWDVSGKLPFNQLLFNFLKKKTKQKKTVVGEDKSIRCQQIRNKLRGLPKKKEINILSDSDSNVFWTYNGYNGV